MSLSTEIEKVLQGSSELSWRYLNPVARKRIISDLARLMETREPDREELILILNRIGLSNSNGNIASGPYTAKAWDKFIDALLSWATTGGTRKRVTRQDIELMLSKYHYLQSTRTSLANDIEALLDPEPSKRWCKSDCPQPIQWNPVSECWVANNYRLDTIQFCSYCGEKRPS